MSKKKGCKRCSYAKISRSVPNMSDTTPKISNTTALQRLTIALQKLTIALQTRKNGLQERKNGLFLDHYCQYCREKSSASAYFYNKCKK